VRIAIFTRHDHKERFDCVVKFADLKQKLQNACKTNYVLPGYLLLMENRVQTSLIKFIH